VNDGYHQRPATAHNARTIRANWGYVRPEKRTVQAEEIEQLARRPVAGPG
jgi:hypothetical protein